MLSRSPEISEILQRPNGFLGRTLAPSVVAARGQSGGAGARDEDGRVNAIFTQSKLLGSFLYMARVDG